jgi:hypothetical protein
MVQKCLICIMQMQNVNFFGAFCRCCHLHTPTQCWHRTTRGSRKWHSVCAAIVALLQTKGVRDQTCAASGEIFRAGENPILGSDFFRNWKADIRSRYFIFQLPFLFIIIIAVWQEMFRLYYYYSSVTRNVSENRSKCSKAQKIQTCLDFFFA